MPEHDGLLHAKLREGLLEERRMSPRRPQPARPLAVAVAGPLDHDDAVAFGQAVHEAGDRKILDQGAVTVDEHKRLAVPALDIVQAHPIHVEEAADRRVLTLSLPRL